MTTNDVEKIYNKLVEWNLLIVDETILEDLKDEFVTQEDPRDSSRQNFRETDPDTSRKASFDYAPKADSNRAKVLRYICGRPNRGWTYEDVYYATRIEGVWKRISELKQGGWIKVGPSTRKSKGGNELSVYYPTEKAMEWYA